MLSPNGKLYVLICLIIFWVSCTTSSMHVKDPQVREMNKLQRDASAIIHSDGLELIAREFTVNETKTSELEVDIANGQNIPKSETDLKALCKQIAQCAKKNLKDPGMFDSYKIVFVKETDGIALIDEHVPAYIFKVSEL
jgi:hypothetical protein